MVQAVDATTSATQRRSTAVRTSLLEQAETFFEANGLTGHSLRSLAKSFDSSHRMLQYHFGTKEGLILEVLETARERSSESVQRALTSGNNFTTDELWRAFLSDESGAKLMYQGLGLALADPDNFGSYAQNTAADWNELATGWLTSRGETGDLEVRATIIVATLRGLFLDLATIGDIDRVSAAFIEAASLLGLTEK